MNTKLLALSAVVLISACVVVQERPADSTPPPQVAPAPAPATAPAPAPAAAAPRQRPIVRAATIPGAQPVSDAGVAGDAQ